MDFELTEEQKQIKALIKEFCEREVDPKEIGELCDRATAATTIEELRECQPWHIIKKAHEIGLRQLAVPVEYEGGGITSGHFVTRAVAGEELGYQCEPLARTFTKPWTWCAQIALADVPEEQKDWFFTEFMKDQTALVAGIGSEPHSMTDGLLRLPYSPSKTIAVKDGDEWVITGDKMFCHAGGVASLLRVSARDKEEPQLRRNFWVTKDAPGMTMRVHKMIDGDLNGNVATSLDNVRVPENQRWGREGAPRREPGSPGVPGREYSLLLFIGLFGGTQKLYDQVVQYAKERMVGGRPMIQHSNTAERLGALACDIEATRSLLYRGCAEADKQQLAGVAINQFWPHAFINLCKKSAFRTAEVANEIYAGVGGTADMPLDRFFRHTVLLSHADSTISVFDFLCSMMYNDHELASQVPLVQEGTS